jgi:restriction system protein
MPARGKPTPGHTPKEQTMALWLIRAGSQGEYERKFLDEERVHLTWDELVDDLTKAKSREAVTEVMRGCLPNAGEGKLRNYVGQVWAFCKSIAPGDWVALPSKFSSTIHFGEITGPFAFDAKAETPFKHYRTCKWIERDLPRGRFDQDLLYSLGAFLTICRITRNDAEARIRAIASNGWVSSKTGTAPVKPANTKAKLEEQREEDVPTEEGGAVDLEQLARYSIARMIDARFKGHGLALLVESILLAQGYSTHRSPVGADHGVDILAGTGPMGFGSPRICPNEERRFTHRPTKCGPARRHDAARRGRSRPVRRLGWVQGNRHARTHPEVLPAAAVGPEGPHRPDPRALPGPRRRGACRVAAEAHLDCGRRRRVGTPSPTSQHENEHLTMSRRDTSA